MYDLRPSIQKILLIVTVLFLITTSVAGVINTEGQNLYVSHNTDELTADRLYDFMFHDTDEAYRAPGEHSNACGGDLDSDQLTENVQPGEVIYEQRFAHLCHGWNVEQREALTGVIATNPGEFRDNNDERWAGCLEALVDENVEGECIHDDSNRDPYSTLTKPFMTGFNDECINGLSGTMDEVNNCELGHTNSDYDPRGEIIMGVEFDGGSGDFPENYNDDLQEFHICNPQQDEDVKYVHSPSSNWDYDYFKCDITDDEFIWENIPDQSDQSQCDPGSVGYENIDGEETVVAYYEQQGECTYDTIFEWDWATDEDGGYAAHTVDEPEIHWCRYDDDGATDCDSEIPANQGAQNWNLQWQEAGEMPVVQYGAYREHFEHLIDNSDSGTAETGFVDAQTGWTTQFQPLYEAEKSYDADGNSNSCDQCHNPDWWESLNMTGVGSGNVGYYDEESAESHYNEREEDALGHEGAWLRANAGPHSDAVDEFSPNFEGGFAGNCPDGETWEYQEGAVGNDPEWECGGEELEEETWNFGGAGGGGNGNGDRPVIPIPDFDTAVHLPGTTPDNGEREIGLTVFGFENIAPEDRDDYVPDVGHYPEVSESGDTDAQLTHIGVQCWAGNLGERPEDADGNFDDGSDRAFSDYTGIDTDEPTSVYQTVNVEDYNGYACEWAYETSDDIGEDGDAMARGESEDVIALHQSQYSSEWNQIADEFNLDDSEFPEN